MMHRIAQLFAAATLAIGTVSAAGAQAATSLVKPISVGISGGAAIPTGDLSNGTPGGFTGVNTGYNITGSLAFGLPLLPFSIRADAAYNSFGTRNLNSPAQGSNVPYNADARVLGFTGNLVLPLPLPAVLLRPYLIGGAGIYNVRISSYTGPSSSQTNFGFNLGGGVTIPFVAFNTFIEARYHHANHDNGSVSFVPITVGVMF